MYALKTGQIYLPDIRFCTLTFVKQLLNGEKLYFYSRDVNMVKVPRFATLSVKIVLDKVASRHDIMRYIPDIKKHDSKAIDREFLFNIVNTVDCEFFNTEIERVEKEREERQVKEESDTIAIRPELYQLIAGLPQKHPR